jgi:hypothetical protein
VHLSHLTRQQVEKVSLVPRVLLSAILRVICPYDLVNTAELSRSDPGAQTGVVNICVRARDCSIGIYNAQLALSNALRYSVSVQTGRPGFRVRSLGCSVMNEQLMVLCDVSSRLNAAADRARQMFGHVPVISRDPLAAVWQLLSLCCLPQHERIAALAPSASIFSLLELLCRRLNSSKLFCR